MSIYLSNVKNQSNQNFINRYINPDTILKTQKVIESSLIYFKEAMKVFALDLYESVFSIKIVTKIPLFIFTYGLFISFGLVETIYYLGLTILILKASKDIVVSLKKQDKFKSFFEYFPKESISKILPLIALGAGFSPILFLLETFSLEESKNACKTCDFEKAKLIQQKGFIGNFASVYAVLLSPIIKEVLFRGYIQSAFEGDKKGTKALIKTILKTALVFALVHLSPASGWTNLPTLITFISIGIILSLLTAKTKNLYASTSAHLLYSFISTLYAKKIT